jgi:RHH-type rel operon transcriptional repressor/antitoxin RelB
MAINVRLEKELEEAFIALARREGVTRSDLVRQCLREFLERKLRSATSWELGKDLFGKFGSGRSDLSSRRKAIVGEKIRAKKDRRRLGSARGPVRQG